MNNLNLRELLHSSLLRIPHYLNKNGQPVHDTPDGSDWSPDQWFNALVGELGEYAGWRKKMDRGEITEQHFRAEGGKELADVLCYLVLLAYHIDIDLTQVTINKFNEVSDRVGSPVRL